MNDVLILVESTEASDIATSFWLGSAALMQLAEPQNSQNSPVL
jgi:hypothetical protein